MLYEGTYQAGSFTEIPVHGTVSYTLCTFMHFFMNDQLQTGAFPSFVKSQSTSSLSTATGKKAIASRLLTNFFSVF